MPAQLQQTLGRRASSMPGERPLIAVSTSEIRRSQALAPTPQGEPPQHEMALGLKYLRAVEAAGGLPVVVPPFHVGCVEAQSSRVAGVCLSCGPDLDPESYGERKHSLTGPIESELDVFELDWVSLERSGKVCRIVKRSRTKVNSFHHRAVTRLGGGLTVTGWASDGTVESLEAADRDFLLGVQWHAECLVDRAPQAALFRGFVDAARAFDQAAARLAFAA
jgi:putative glutamine amidotransferase